MKVTFLGDTHGRFEVLDKIAEQEKPNVIIQCGDFGIWPKKTNEVFANTDVPIYFCRGNHEDHDILDTFPRESISRLCDSPRVVDDRLLNFRQYTQKEAVFLKDKKFPVSNIHLADTGSVLNEKILFLGGAESIDRYVRTTGISWWPQEIMSHKQYENIIGKDLSKIEVIVSHTAPAMIVNKLYSDGLLNLAGKINDPTTFALEQIYYEVNPKLWIFGHFHVRWAGNFTDCRFECLDMCDPRDGSFDEDFYLTLDV